MGMGMTSFVVCLVAYEIFEMRLSCTISFTLRFGRGKLLANLGYDSFVVTIANLQFLNVPFASVKSKGKSGLVDEYRRCRADDSTSIIHVRWTVRAVWCCILAERITVFI